MKVTTVVDTNVIIRFFLNDDPRLSAQAQEVFQSTQKSNASIYIDELIVAEVIWLLSSYYKKGKQEIISLLDKLLSQAWVVNPRKKLVQKTLTFYNSHTVSFIDSWTLMVAKSKQFPLTTFDRTLDKLAKST